MYAQDLVQPLGSAGPALFQNDLAVLEDRQSHSELPCTVEVAPPSLDFDLKLHSGYDVSLPLHELAGVGPGTVDIVFRVIPEGREPVYFSQRFRTPAIDAKARGVAQLQGGFDLGPGTYRVDWLLRDARQRICSSHWGVKASLPGSERLLPPALGPGVVQTSRRELFEEVSRAARGSLHVKILVNFAPQEQDAAVLPRDEKRAIVAMLRNIAREPRIGSFTVVAFNLRDQQVLYRQSGASKIDFPALGKALRARRAGTIDVRHLANKHGDTAFLRKLLSEEVTSPEANDAVIFVGPKAVLDQKLSTDALKSLGGAQYPVFYLEYNPDPAGNPWRDTIGIAVRFLKGREYAITRPRDLWLAWRDVMSRLRDGGGPSIAAR